MIIANKIKSILTPREWRSAIYLLVLMVIGAVLEMIGVGIVVPAIALLMEPDILINYPMLSPIFDRIGQPSQNELILGGILILVIVYVFKVGFLGFLAWRQSKFAFGVQRQLAERLFNLYLSQPYTFHIQRNSAKLLNNITTEINQFTAYGVLPGIILLAEVFVLVGVSSLLLVIEPIPAVIMFLIFGLAAWVFNALTKRKISKWGRIRHHHEELRLKEIQQALGGIKEILLLNRTEELTRRFGKHNLLIARAAQYKSTFLQLPKLWFEFIAVIGLSMLIVVLYYTGRETTSILPVLGLFAAAAFRLMPSANRIVGSLQNLRFGLPVIDMLVEELKLQEIKRVEPIIKTNEFKSIVASNVSFSYPKSKTPAVSNVSFSLIKGESIGIVGASGSGKSTLMDLILGLLEPDSGSIIVDGVNIQMKMKEWQTQLGYVPQSIYLTDDTLRKNVAFGLNEDQIDEDSIKRALEAAQLMDFVSSIPNGMDTIVGERGIRLSGGQRQRIGIARALYHNPNVLVLDEATSALDMETENEVMKAVRALHGKTTVIIVAHRLSTIAHCDRVLSIENGKVRTQLSGS